MKLNRLIVLLVVLAMTAISAVGQETESRAFVLELSAALSEIGWDDDVVTEFEESADDLDWSGAENADPKLVAWAFAHGMPEDGLAVQEQTQLALALATHTATMTRLGYTERDIAAAAMQATRAAAEEMAQTRNEVGNPDVGEMVRSQLNDALGDQTQTATRARSGNASGSTYRIGGESEPGVPLNPDDPPSPGDPVGPGDGTPDNPTAPSGPQN